MAPLGPASISELTGNSAFVLIGSTLFIVGNTTAAGQFKVYSSADYGITAAQVATYTFPSPSPDFDPAVCTDGTFLFILGTRHNADGTEDIVWFSFDPGGPTLTGPTDIVTGLVVGSDYDLIPLASGHTCAAICSFSSDDRWSERVDGYDISATGVAGAPVLIASSVARGGLTYDSVSLATDDGIRLELYVTNHPKSITFGDYTMTVGLFTSPDSGATFGAVIPLLTLPVRHVGSDLTVISSGNNLAFGFNFGFDFGISGSARPRWLSTTYYTQNRAGLSGNILLGHVPDSNDINSVPWNFKVFPGSPQASLVEASINVFTDDSTVLGFVTRDLTRNPAVDGIVSVNSLDVAAWRHIPLTAFRNPAPLASWLRGTKSLLPPLAHWGFLVEQREAPGNSTFYSGFEVPPVAAITPVAVNPAFRNQLYTFDASTSFDPNFNPLEYEWNLQIGVGIPFPAWQALHAYLFGDEILDGNGNVQIAVLAGTSGAIEPLSQWQPLTAYLLGHRVVDSNGFIQQVTLAGTSGEETPFWSTQPSDPTGDGSVVWTNENAATDFWDTTIEGRTLDGSVVWATAITLTPVTVPSIQNTTAEVLVGFDIGPGAQVFQVQVGVIDLDSNGAPIHTPPTGTALAQATLSLPFIPLPVIAWTGNFIDAPLWVHSTAYALGFVIYDGSHMQEATTAGTSGLTVPTFNHAGGTTADDTVIWTDLGVPVSSPASVFAGRNTGYTLAPTITPGQANLPLTYSWSQVSGTPVNIGGASGPTLAILTHGVNLNHPPADGLVFELVVNDGVNVPVSSTVTLNVVPYIFNFTDSHVLARSNWAAVTDYIQEVHAIPGGFGMDFGFEFGFATAFIVSVDHPPTGGQSFVDGGVSYSGGGNLTVVTTPPLVGQYNVSPTGDYSFSAADMGLAIKITYSITQPATISQRNSPQAWLPLSKSAVYTDLTGFKRDTALGGENRFIVVSPATVLVYGDFILVRKLLVPDTDLGAIEDAVNTEHDYTVVLTDTNHLYRYSSAPLVNTDDPDTTLNLSDYVTLPVPTYPAWQANTLYVLGEEILDSNGNVQIVIQSSVSSGFGLFGDDFGASFSEAIPPLWNPVRNGLTNDGPILLWKNLGKPVIFETLFSTPVFANSRVVALSGANGCFLMQLDSALFTVQGFFEISVESGLVYGADNVQWVRESNVESLHTGKVLLGTLDSEGRTFETLIDLTHRLVLGTWDASKLKNRYVTTGEILFEHESPYVGLPSAPVMQTATVNSKNNKVTLTWVAERPDLTTSYQLRMSVDGGIYNPLARVGSGSVQIYTTASLAPNHTYSFEVRSDGADGPSPFSLPISAFIGVPQPPLLNRVTQVSGPDTGPFVVTVTWSQQNPDTDVVSGYAVQMSTDNGNFATVANIADGENTSYSAGPLAANHTHNFRVASLYNGVQTPYSGTASVTFPGGAEVAVPPQALVSGGVGVAYTQQLFAGVFVTRLNGDIDFIPNGVAPYTWVADPGGLPPGLQLDADSGIISGTPSAPGTYNFSVLVVDSAEPTGYVSDDSPVLTIVIS